MRRAVQAGKQLVPPAKEILDIIQCPLSKGPLIYVANTHEVVSPVARIAFPVSDSGLINLYPHDARVLSPAESIPEQNR
jgi:uncharacterized protein YbaR (Trm112 family)